MVSRPAALLELINVCYKSFSLNFGGDGAGGTEELLVLEFLAAVAFSLAFSSISWHFSLVLVLVLLLFDDVAPLGSGGCCGSVCGVF